MRIALDAGFDHYILKPANLSAMLAPFKEMLSKKKELSIVFIDDVVKTSAVG